MATKRNTLELIIRTIKKGRGADEAKREMEGLKKAGGESAVSLTQLGIAFGAVTTAALAAKQAIDFAKEGAAIARLQEAGDALASNFGQDMNAIVQSMQQASGGTLSEMEAMQAANQALQLGVATTPEEFAKLTKSSIALGRAMGRTANESIKDIITGIGRMSPLILDNLGITTEGGAVYERYADSLGKSADALTDTEKKQALLNATVESAGPLLDATGNLARDSASNWEIIGAAIQDAKSEAAQFADTLLGPVADAVATTILETDDLNAVIELTGAEVRNVAGRTTFFVDGIRRSREELFELAKALGESAEAASDADRVFARYRSEVDEVTNSFDNLNVMLSDELGEALDDFDEKREAITREQMDIRNQIRDIEDLGVTYRGGAEEVERLRQELRDTREEHGEMSEEMIAAYGRILPEIAKIESGSYLTPAQQAEVDRLKEELAGTEESMRDLRATHDEETKRMILNFAQQSAAADGVISDQDVLLIQTMAEEWGLLGETTIGAMADAQEAVVQANSGALEPALQTLRDAHAEASGLGESLKRLPSEKIIDIIINQQGSVGTGLQPDAEFGGQFAFGGFQVGGRRSNGNDSTLIGVNPGERVTVEPSGGPGGRGGVNIGVVNINNNTDLETFKTKLRRS